MAYVRGNKYDYDRWETEFGASGWNYDTALKYAKQFEGNQQPSFVQYENGRYHSANGPQNIDFLGNLSSFEQSLLQAATENGHSFIEDINADKYIGYTNLQAFYFDGRRQSAAKSYLNPAKNRPNLLDYSMHL